MGRGHQYICKCQKDWRYIHTGIGFFYPSECEDVYNAALSGEFGPEWKAAIEEHPDGAFDCSREVYICSHCGFWEVSEKKSYYISANGNPLECKFIMPCDRLIRPIKCIRKFRHICPECRKVMHLADLKKEALICKKCGQKLEVNLDSLLWD